MNYYNELTLRNGYFMSAKLQKKIKDATLVFIGCGLASTVATACARLGFTKFVLVDGDKVETSNLNRQDFYVDDIGRNKALVIGNRLKKINKDIIVQVIQRHIGADEVERIVSMGDIVINSADFDEVTYKINEVCNAQAKLSISPLNIGFGTITTVFTRNSATLEDLTEGIAKSDKDYLIKFSKNINYKLPKYISKNIIKAFLFITRKGFFPQNMIAAQASCLAIEHTIIRYLAGKKISTAPDVIAFDMEARYE